MFEIHFYASFVVFPIMEAISILDFCDIIYIWITIVTKIKRKDELYGKSSKTLN